MSCVGLGSDKDEATFNLEDDTIFGPSAGKSEFHEFGEFDSASPQPPIDCQLTLLVNNEGAATKVFDLDGAGQLRSQSAANIYEGLAKRIAVAGLADLRDLVQGLQPNQAFCFGVAENQEARLFTQETLRSGSVPGAIARDREHFSFRAGQPGILMLDCDTRAGHRAPNYADIDKIIAGIIPAWSNIQRLWRPSASAFIYRASDDSELIGMGGWRCYVIVDNAAAIPNVGAFLYQRFWDLGHGYIKISQSGQALDRSLIDACVWAPERIDFAAPPVLAAGLIRRAPPSVVLGSSPLLATSALKATLGLSEWRQSSEALRTAKEAARPECEKLRRSYIDGRVEILSQEFPKASKKRLERVTRQAVEEHILTADFILHRSDGSTITVGEVLADQDKWHHARFADPLEPNYRNDPRIAYACLDPTGSKDPFIYSHAHGGIFYRLVRPCARILLKKGERPQALDAALALIRDRGELYERGGELVRIAGESIVPVSDHWQSDYFGRHIDFTEMKLVRGQWLPYPADPPYWLCPQISAKRGERGLRTLNGIITAPTLRPDGSLLCSPGFDEETGLLLRGSGWPEIPDQPSDADLHTAFNTVWTPFVEFPFVSKEDRGVMLAAILTAIVRRCLPRAPAFSFDAPVAGTGKTLLGLCLLLLCGTSPTVIPECREEEELRKRLLAILREGKPGFLFDNIRGQFGSAALEAFLTSESYSDRVLGYSQTLTFPTNVLVLISGNNFQPKGDLYRRLLTARIDARTDAPERRSFELKPDEYCVLHRQEIVTAGLTLLRAFVVAGLRLIGWPPSRTGMILSVNACSGLRKRAVLNSAILLPASRPRSSKNLNARSLPPSSRPFSMRGERRPGESGS